ncbi:MAG: serine hydrolase [Ferruginibacter sp.]|nr:serine hydrolase [Chitinophagaceae bacterium]
MRYCLFLLLLVLTNVVNSQLVITGKVIDENDKPLAAVSVRMIKKGTGTITNNSGSFSLNIPHTISPDTLLISFLGYEQKKISTEEMKGRGMLLIKMAQKMEIMQEVVIKPVDPVALINSAIDHIPANYYHKPHISKGFYRIDTKKGGEHIMLSEAVFDIYNYGYAQKKDNAFRLVKMRFIEDEKALHGLDLGIKPKEIYRDDIVKEISASDLLSKKGLKNHRFKLNRIINYNGTDAWEISFDQKDGIKESLYSGKIYIAVNSFAIIAIQQARSEKGIAYAKFGDVATRTMLKLVGIDIDILKESSLVTYQHYGEKWILSNVKSNYILNFKSDKRFYDFPANIKTDYVVTGIDTAGIREFSGKEIMGNSKVIEFHNTGGEKDFWNGYNIILADFNSDSIAKQIMARNEFHNLKKQIVPLLKKFPVDKGARIDSILSFYYQKSAFNGTVLIKNNGKIILQKGYGVSDKEKKIPATDTTQYRIGSLTKSFTSLVVQQLASENKLALTDPVGKFIPQYVHKNITLEQLLTHTSGIPNYTNNLDYLLAITTQDLRLKDVIFRFCSDTLEFKPGSEFHYSNSGYTVLAAVIENVTGKTYGQVLSERIFDPLKMRQTAFGLDSINSKGYWLDNRETIYKIKNFAGAGGISSTVNDLLKWDEALYTSELLSQQQLLQVFVPRFAYDDWDAYYGYGWMIDKKLFNQSKKHVLVYHPGTDLGYYSMFVRQPDENNLIIMLSNSGDFPRFDMTDLILDILN